MFKDSSQDVIQDQIDDVHGQVFRWERSELFSLLHGSATSGKGCRGGREQAGNSVPSLAGRIHRPFGASSQMLRGDTAIPSIVT